MRGSSHHPPTIRVEYDSLAEIAGRFARESEAIRATRLELSFRNDALRAGDWIGRGARAFYAEMELDILPAITRLADALDNAERATLQIRARMQIAERDAAIVLAGRPGGPDLDGMRVLASSMPDLRATAVIGGLTQILPVQVDASRPFPPAYAPAWMEPARLLVSLLPSLDGGDRSMFFLLLGQTPLGAELMARDPGLAAKLDIRVLPDQGLRQLGLIHGREGISFPARDGHYLIGVSQMDLRKAEDVGVLAHEVMHAYQREHASDPSRVSDFTQMAMEREAYLFQVGVELALALPNAPTAGPDYELGGLLAGDGPARATVLTHDALGVYAAAPAGVGGTLEGLGFSRAAVEPLYQRVRYPSPWTRDRREERH